MDVSLRHWPIFATGLLLGAAGTMSLGLHRPTQAELAAAASAIAAKPVVAVSATAPAETVVQAGSAEQVDGQMLAAAGAFRAQELLAAANAPFAVALARPPKPRVRSVVQVADGEAFAAPIAASPTIAIAPNAAFEPVARLRATTSVMGAASEASEPRQAPE